MKYPHQQNAKQLIFAHSWTMQRGSIKAPKGSKAEIFLTTTCFAALALFHTYSTAASDKDLELSDGFRAYLEQQAPHYVTGNELFRYSPGVIRLFSVGISDADASMKRGTKGYCVPNGASAGQVGDVVSKFLEANPAVRHLPAAHLVRQAFRSAWPC